ncbi:hypothetical protein SAMN05660206_103356 [Sphingobacterium wenxiniae]|uniref:Uncharacterized protein n=1 Tax=Sphingobacterium wenxiniae TaxID=683125 RepID=A0A1I6RC15_9SPHI|nr:hypothetical protein SAMN05660206_103356 [Sphingobacterium wenxiniae]
MINLISSAGSGHSD